MSALSRTLRKFTAFSISTAAIVHFAGCSSDIVGDGEGTGGGFMSTGGWASGTGGTAATGGGVSTGGTLVSTGGSATTGGAGPAAGGAGPGAGGAGPGAGGAGPGAGGAGPGAGGGAAAGGGTMGTGGGGGDVECVLPEFPDAGSLPDLGMKLPDPFTFFDGTPVTTKAQWECRRKEILAMAAKYLYGPVPGDCDEVSGTVNGGNVSITCTVGGNSENFTATISGSGEAIGVSLSGAMLPQGKSLSLGNGNEGKIGSLFGISGINPNIATGWMISRVIEVLEQNPESGHDPTKIAVSGCSGCGKGAFLAGVFSKAPLVVIVESGGGGGTSWRMTEWFRHGAGNSRWNCGDLPQGIDNLEETGICGPWVTSAAQPFRNNAALVNHLPFDQHMLLATIAPRHLVHFTNDNGSGSWCHLAGTSEALASWAAHSVYKALGIPERHSFEVYSGGHCSTGDTGIAAAMFDRVINGNMSADTGKINIQDSRVQVPVSEWPGLFIDWDMDTVLQ